MKSFINASLRAVALAVAAFVTNGSVNGATLNVSPSSINNEYAGDITLTAGGLLNGEAIVVDQIADLNGNGLIDAGESIVQSASLIDGQVFAIAGIRHPSVPGDNDMTSNGQVTASFAYQGGAEFSRVVAPFLFRLSSPTARFSAVVQNFAVTAAPHAQTISGTVRNGATPVAGASVAVLQQFGNDDEYRTGVLTDANGNFSLPLPTGSYFLIPIKSGFVGSFNDAAAVTLTSGATTNLALNLIAPTHTYSGRLVDAATSQGLAGVQYFLEGDSDDYTAGFTDATGAFSFGLSAGGWQISPSENSLVSRGYLEAGGEMTIPISSSVSGVTQSVMRATAMVYGRLLDDQTNAVANVEIFGGMDGGGSSASFALTDTNGLFYLLLGSGSWSVGASSTDLSPLNLSSSSINITLTNNQAFSTNLVARRNTAVLHGRVVDSVGNAVENLGIGASRQDANGYVSTMTGTNGTFVLGVSAGTWTIQLENESAQQRSLIGPSLSVAVTDGSSVSNIVYVVRSVTRQIAVTVRNTTNGPIAGVPIFASTVINGTNYNVSSNTDGSGAVSLGVIEGNWLVGLSTFGPGGISSRGYQAPTNQTVSVTTGNGVANFTVVPFTNQRPTLTAARRSTATSFEFRLTGEPGRDYRVDWSSDLKIWNPLQTRSAFNSEIFFEDPAATNSTKYYRAVLVP